MKKSVLVFLALVLVSCSDPLEITDNKAVCLDIYSKMKEWYLWNDRIPEINALNYSTPYDMMEEIKYKPVDKWSSVYPLEYFWVGMPKNFVTGHGIRLALDQDNEPRIASIYKQSDLYASGVRRGWAVKTVNGTLLAPVLMSDDPEALNNLLGGPEEGIKNVFEFINPDGERVILESTQDYFEADAVMMCDTLHLSSGVTGYLVMDSFYDSDEEEMAAALTWLKSCNITDLIVDLRYNNDGLFPAARFLASAIAGDNYSRTDWLKINYNQGKTDYQPASARFIATGYDLGLDRVVFITTKNTSAGSELVISGLSPYLDVTVVGSQTTGNPAGLISFSYTLPSPGQDILPATYFYSIVFCEFRSATSPAALYDGIVADVQAQDDVTHDFGNRNEASLAAAISVIEGNGVARSQARSITNPVIFKEESGTHLGGATYVP